MRYKFLGGPYDGMEIDDALINAHAKLLPVTSDLGTRLFVCLPDSREDWERLVRGESVQAQKLLAYERAFTAIGVCFISSPPGSVDRALSEAKLKVHSRAQTALSALGAVDGRRVLEAVDALQRQSPTTWSAEMISAPGDAKPLYVLNVTPDLRAFVRVEGGQVELIDIARKDTLQLFLKRDRGAAVPQ